jgi:hypothetical protein
MDGDRLIELYKTYLAAFNAHSLEGVKECLSPTCCALIAFTGKQIHSRAELLPQYIDDFASGRFSQPITIREIRPINRGVWVTLINPNDGKDVEVEYYYNEEGLQIFHLIKSVNPSPPTAIRQERNTLEGRDDG